MILAAYYLSLIALTGWSIWRAVERLRDYCILAFLTIVLLPLLVTTVSGDLSRYFPTGTFAAGFEGKDQVIIVSATTALLVAAMLASVLLRLIRCGWRKLRARS